MDITCRQATIRGPVSIPGSKSHTIRAVAIAALAEGDSVLHAPLVSRDALSAVSAFGALGAVIEQTPEVWRIKGIGGVPRVPDDVVDVMNSGTTMNIALGAASLLPSGLAVLTGDDQIRRRPCEPLAHALNDLGARVRSTRGNGCPPYVVEGVLRGGHTQLEALSSQYVTSLLINAPLAEGDTRLDVPVLHEQPYVWMTLDWLRRQGIRVEHDETLRAFHIPGGQRYQAFERRIPADFSTATFFLAAGALPENDVTCLGLDMDDTQGDRAVVDYLQAFGANVEIEAGSVRVSSGALQGCAIDLNATPDALPMMAALACFAEGTTRLLNVPQARIKETDRIAVMREELSKMGACIEELPDGLVVHESALHGAEVDGHGDHRVVMALAIAATAAKGDTRIRGYEAVTVTFPEFAATLRGAGGDIETTA